MAKTKTVEALKEKILVKCPECSKNFFTKKTECQCSGCGERFDSLKNKVKLG